MKRYKHIFFDLDKTLWDFNSNTSKTLKDIISFFDLSEKINNVSTFINSYFLNNEYVWKQFKNKNITKEQLKTERFRLLLEDFDIINPSLTNQINEYFIKHSPNQTTLIADSTDILEYLSKSYSLYIVSNGFLETQTTKLKASGIYSFFQRIYTSEQIGASKPSKKFFEYAIKSSNARKKDSVVIGDDLTNDIGGAASFGIDQIWFNPGRSISEYNPTYMIHDLVELKKIL